MGWFTAKKQLRQAEAENAQLRQDNARLKAQVAELQAENARLSSQLAAARKHSGNSSKPPSSDIVKPKDRRRKKKSKRRIGGQKGHPQHQRPAFAPEQVDQWIPLRLDHCPVDPSHRISPAQGPEHPRTLQQVELVEKPFRIVQYTAYSIWCQDCGSYHQAPLPEPIRTSAGFCEIGLSGKIRIQSFPPRLMKRMMATRLASICRSVIQPGSSTFNP
jgi:hypothetical protein